MDNSAYLDFCYKQYLGELSEVDNIYRRGGILLTAIVILFGGLISLGDLSRLSYFGTRLDASLYSILLLITVALLCIATVRLMGVFKPVKYERVARSVSLNEWRAKYESMIKESGISEISQIDTILAHETQRAVTTRLAEASSHNFDMNRRRLGLFEQAFHCIMWSVPTVGALAALDLWMTLLGVQ